MSTEPEALRSTSTYPETPAPRPVPVEQDRPGRERPPSAPVPSGKGKPPPRRKRKARKVHRVVRHLDVWSVAKVTAIFVACGYIGGLISGFLLWQAADRVGTIDGIEGFIESSAAYDEFQILGGVVFRVAAVAGFAIALLVLALVVLAALLFNLVSDLTGGIRMTVIDEDLIVAPARRPAPPSRPPAGGDPSG